MSNRGYLNGERDGFERDEVDGGEERSEDLKSGEMERGEESSVAGGREETWLGRG